MDARVPEQQSANTHPRRLPSVDRVLRTPLGSALADRFGHPATVEAIRQVLADARAEPVADLTAETAADAAHARLQAAATSKVRAVFNLTGTVLHTNLGRAVLAEAAVEAATVAMRQAVALEFDIDQGRRGERDDLVRGLICELTGAEDATIVNNNAAAVLIALNTLADGREAIVSRGELIEIGGAFRMPAIMQRAGARLVEVGTTNRTHPSDYEEAIGADTGLILKVHTSNYRIEGFTAEVAAADLAGLAHRHGLPLVDDLGSGTLVDLRPFGLPHERTVAEAVADGVDLVTFSGDKLLGGPQAGFIVGRRDLIARINRNPLKRTMRVDKIRLAAIEATLRLYRDPERLAETVPTYRWLARRRETIEATAQRLAPEVARRLGPSVSVEPVPCASQVGSGAVPVETLASAALALTPSHGGGGTVEDLARALRLLPTPVIGRIVDGAVRLDLRCLDDEAGFLETLAAFPGLPGDRPTADGAP